MHTNRSFKIARLMLMAALAVSAGSATGEDDPDRRSHPVQGDYGLTATEVCIETPLEAPPAMGFNHETRELLRDAQAVPAVIAGIISFGPKGDVRLDEAKITGLFINRTTVGEIPVNAEAPLSCEGTQVSASERRISFELSCKVELPGGVSVAIETLMFEGLVGIGQSVITLSSTRANVQTSTIIVNNTPVRQRERICALAGTLAKLERTHSNRNPETGARPSIAPN
jgi:hypothetical protein